MVSFLEKRIFLGYSSDGSLGVETSAATATRLCNEERSARSRTACVHNSVFTGSRTN